MKSLVFMSNRMSRRFFQILALFALVVGAAGFIYSLNLSAYKNEAIYQSQYMDIDIEASSEAASKQFHELRDSQLTHKYKFQDYSLTLFSMGVVLLSLFVLGGSEITAPSSKKKIIFLGIFLALITSGASFSTLILDFNRGEFPWWADSLGIPILTQELPLLFMLIVWVMIHFLFLRGPFEYGKPIFRPDVLRSNYWLSFIAVISLILLFEAIVRGNFIMVIPGSLWIYFYFSLASGWSKKRA